MMNESNIAYCSKISLPDTDSKVPDFTYGLIRAIG